MTTIPTSHLDLLARPLGAVLTTMMPDGQPQSSVVWVDHDGDRVRVPTTRERQKGQNVQDNGKVSLLVVDPEDTSRFLCVIGDAELVEDGAEAHLDELTRLYTGHPCFYGHVYPLEQRARDTRVICRIRPRRVITDAIHRS